MGHPRGRAASGRLVVPALVDRRGRRARRRLRGGHGILAVHARAAYLERDRLEEAAASSARAWLRTNARPGDTVAFGRYLGYEIALDLPSGVRAVRIRPQLLAVDPTAPLGLRSGANRPADVVSLDVAAGKATEFDAYTASQLERAVAESSADYIVYPISESSSAAGVLDALTPAAGAELLGSWKQVGSGDTIDVLIYRIGPNALHPDASRMVATPEALDRLTTHLESQPTVARGAAGALLDRLITGDHALDPIVARLERLAGR